MEYIPSPEVKTAYGGSAPASVCSALMVIILKPGIKPLIRPFKIFWAHKMYWKIPKEMCGSSTSTNIMFFHQAVKS